MIDFTYSIEIRSPDKAKPFARRGQKTAGLIAMIRRPGYRRMTEVNPVFFEREVKGQWGEKDERIGLDQGGE